MFFRRSHRQTTLIPTFPKQKREEQTVYCLKSLKTGQSDTPKRLGQEAKQNCKLPHKKFQHTLMGYRESTSPATAIRGWLMSSSWLKLSPTFFFYCRVAVDIFTIHKCEIFFCLLAIKISCGNDKLITCCVKKINF